VAPSTSARDNGDASETARQGAASWWHQRTSGHERDVVDDGPNMDALCDWMADA
jgi:hypothetical protein